MESEEYDRNGRRKKAFKSIPGVAKLKRYIPEEKIPEKVLISQSKLLHFSLLREQGANVHNRIHKQSTLNRGIVLRRLKNHKNIEELVSKNESNVLPKSHKQALYNCIKQLPIPTISKTILSGMKQRLPDEQRKLFPAVILKLEEEITKYYEESLRKGILFQMIKTQDEEEEITPFNTIQSAEKRIEGCAPWHDTFVKNRRRIRIHLHLLHPALRQSLSVCKDHLNSITLTKCDCYNGEAIDLDSFCGNIISECEKTEETLMNTWFHEISTIFSSNSHVSTLPEDRLLRFYQCASSLLSIQLRDLIMRSVISYVDIFGDERKLPRIEMELVLKDDLIVFSPSLEEVSDMILSVITEMKKLLREVPTMESCMYTEGKSSFVQVAMDQDFVTDQLNRLEGYIDCLLTEPKNHAKKIVSSFRFLIDGSARREIITFIQTHPKFETICCELQTYNKYIEKTQEISSLEYFPFVRLDCEKVRRGLGDTARTLSNILLKNVVDTYRKENERICEEFSQIERVALRAPRTTKEMIELGEFMLDVKNKKMIQLTDMMEDSKKHLLYLIDVHIFSKQDILLNTETLAWPEKIKPVFEQNTEIIEDCKARFEDHLQKKSDWIIRELNKLSLRVQELEELGEISSVQQYTYVSRDIPKPP